MSLVKFLLDQEGLKKGAAISKDEIGRVEKELNVKFAAEYNDYLSKLGMASYDDTQLTGIGIVKYRDVCAITKEYRGMNSHCENLYVIEDLGIDSLVIWQDSKGKIYQTVGGSKPEKIFDSILEYLQDKTE